jgi:hypothetical protein
VEILERIHLSLHLETNSNVKAFYSSDLGGISNQPLAMSLHLDNSYPKQCLPVYDRLYFRQGHVHLLRQHLGRFFKSVRAARLSLPFSNDRVEKTILETCAASMTRTGKIYICLYPHRYLFSRSSLCVQVFEEEQKKRGLNKKNLLMTCSIPSKFGAHAQVSSTWHSAGIVFDVTTLGEDCHKIFLDVYGFVANCFEYNLLIYTGDGRLLVPSFENTYADPSVQRMIALVNYFLQNDFYNNRRSFEWLYKNIKSAEFTPSLCPREICDLSKELFIIGNGQIKPIHRWDEQRIGEHFLEEESNLCRVLCTIMDYDKTYPGYDEGILTPIPYSKYTLN